MVEEVSSTDFGVEKAKAVIVNELLIPFKKSFVAGPSVVIVPEVIKAMKHQIGIPAEAKAPENKEISNATISPPEVENLLPVKSDQTEFS